MSQKNSKLGAVVLVVVLAGGYYLYSTFFSEDVSSATQAEISKSLLSSDVVNFLETKDKINLKDISFSKTSLYKMLVDFSEVIPETTERGRPDPFIPYAPTGPIR